MRRLRHRSDAGDRSDHWRRPVSDMARRARRTRLAIEGRVARFEVPSTRFADLSQEIRRCTHRCSNCRHLGDSLKCIDSHCRPSVLERAAQPVSMKPISSSSSPPALINQLVSRLLSHHDLALLRSMDGVANAYATNSYPLEGGGWSMECRSDTGPEDGLRPCFILFWGRTGS